MIGALIHWSLRNRFLVLMAVALACAWGVYSMTRMPVDASPDLSDRRT